MPRYAILALAALSLASCATDPTPTTSTGPWCPAGTQAVKTPGTPGPDNIVCKPYGNTD